MTNNPVFSIVDVFAEQKYAGNPLAVFSGADDLSSDEMQHIAREINFSETTFIGAGGSIDDGYPVRIFTPAEEVPFAGHPTLGTAHIICETLLHGQAGQVTLNLKAGKIPVTFSPDGRAFMRQLAPVFGLQHDPAALADVLGLRAGQLDGRFPVEEVSTGLPFFIVPLKDIAALKQAKAEREKYFALIAHTEAKGILVFCPEPHEAGNDLSVRVFVDYYGVPEDPATGSGNGCLAGYLVKHRYFGGERIDLRVEQGCEIGRPSLLYLKAEARDGEIEIQVGGRSVTVARGEWL